MDLNGNSKETVYPFCTPTKESSLQQSEATSKESDHAASASSGKGVPETPTANYAKYLEILRRQYILYYYHAINKRTLDTITIP